MEKVLRVFHIENFKTVFYSDIEPLIQMNIYLGFSGTPNNEISYLLTLIREGLTP